MKTKLFLIGAFALLSANTIMAQDVTTVNAKSSDISDNLDLRAVASIFGESANLEDFERRLNDPKNQISNLDLNNDGNVDYLRVIESVEGGTHLVVIQSVLEKDVYQDVATVEVEKDSNNQVQVQVVGNVYMYGPDYIYEPVYIQQPIIYSSFWVGSYHPYYSPYYYNYYPTYYHSWNPYPVYRYRRNVNVFINVDNHYNYVTTRRSQRAVALYSGRRANGYEVRNPNRSFTQRNTNVINRHELDVRRGSVANGGRTQNGTRGGGTINGGRTQANNSTPTRNNVSNSGTGNTRNNSTTAPVRNNGAVRNNTAIAPARNNSALNNSSDTPIRSNTATQVRSNTVSTPSRSSSTMSGNNQSVAPVRASVPQQQQPIRTETRQAEPARTQSPEPVRAQQQSAPAPSRAQSAPVQSQQRSEPARAQSSSPSRGNSEQRSSRR